MRFVYPEFLYALFTIAIPVVVHLFNFRRFKKIFFTNVRFLREIKEETTSRSKLKHLLVLLSRILTISFLVLAFAQPYLPAGPDLPPAGEQVISVYVDNSFSMESVSREGTYLDEAKKRAREIALAGKPSDVFQLLTNDFEGRHQRLISREQFLTWIDDIQISPAARRLSDVITRQHDLIDRAGTDTRSIYCVSDFQASQADFSMVKNDTATRLYLVPVQVQPTGNVFIDSCWFSSPVIQADVPVELNARLVNASETPAENISLKLSINNVQKSLAGASLDAGAQTTARLSFTVTEPGLKKGRLEINDYPVTFDNQWFFTFALDSNQQLLNIHGKRESASMKALFAGNDFFDLASTPSSRIDYSTLSDYPVIFLDGLPEISTGMSDELVRYTRDGGTVVLFPDTAVDLESYNLFLGAAGADPWTGLNMNPDKVGLLTAESPLFADVFEKKPGRQEQMDLPVALKHFDMTTGQRSAREVIMRLQGGAPFMCRYPLGKGSVYVFTVALDHSFGNFTRHAIYVPVVFRMALLSGSRQKLFYRIGADESVVITEKMAGEDLFHLVNTDKEFDIIPEIRPAGGQARLVFHDAVREAGIYDILLNDRPVGALAFNYDRTESMLSYPDREMLDQAIAANPEARMQVLEATSGGLTSRLMTMNEGLRLWKWCVWLVLLFLAVEVLLLRFWK